jgi:chromosome partitioning protein
MVTMGTANSQKDFCLSLLDLAALFDKDPKVILKDLQKVCGPQSTVNYILPETVRKYIYAKGLRLPHKVVSFQMLKGGVAKTTSALNFGLRSAMYGARVLFIDLDQQANLTFALGMEDESRPVWVDVVEKRLSLKDVRVEIEEGIDLIPSSLNNSVLDRVLLSGSRNWAQAVKGPLKEIEAEYDLVIIDTAPNLSATNTAVTCASNLVILPINPDKFSLLGVRKHLEDLNDLKKDFDLEFENRILFTKFDGRESSSHEMLSNCIGEFADILLKNYVRTSTDIKNHIGSSRTIFANKSNAKEDYDLVTKELLGL